MTGNEGTVPDGTGVNNTTQPQIPALNNQTFDRPFSPADHAQKMVQLLQEVMHIPSLDEVIKSYAPLDPGLTIDELAEERRIRKGLTELSYQTKLRNELNHLQNQFTYQMPPTMTIQSIVFELGKISSLIATVTQKLGEIKLYMERCKKRRAVVYRAAMRVSSGTVKDKENYSEEVANNSLQDTEYEMSMDKFVKIEGIYNALDTQFSALRKMANLIELETQLHYGKAGG